jgi:hypothetical protein
MKHTVTPLPCPFCGSDNVAAWDYWCTCKDCGAEIAEQRERCNPALSKRDNNVLAWNRRKSGQYKDSCPFCGGNNLGLSVSEADKGRFWMYCQDCFALGPDGSTEDEAEQLWSR